MTPLNDGGVKDNNAIVVKIVALTLIVVLKLEFEWAVQTCRKGGDDIAYFFSPS